MLNLSQLISDFEACIGFPYASPGTNDERGIDCSGMFVRAFRRQGASIYHGSNTIFRKYLAHSGTIASAADLRPGMAVFKWKSETPARFSDGLGDFCHIGLVTSVSPLRIVHASTEGMAVKADSKIGKSILRAIPPCPLHPACPARPSARAAGAIPSACCKRC